MTQPSRSCLVDLWALTVMTVTVMTVTVMTVTVTTVTPRSTTEVVAAGADD
jgi:hypothetical protein